MAGGPRPAARSSPLAARDRTARAPPPAPRRAPRRVPHPAAPPRAGLTSRPPARVDKLAKSAHLKCAARKSLRVRVPPRVLAAAVHHEVGAPTRGGRRLPTAPRARRPGPVARLPRAGRNGRGNGRRPRCQRVATPRSDQGDSRRLRRRGRGSDGAGCARHQSVEHEIGESLVTGDFEPASFPVWGERVHPCGGVSRHARVGRFR